MSKLGGIPYMGIAFKSIYEKVLLCKTPFKKKLFILSLIDLQFAKYLLYNKLTNLLRLDLSLLKKLDRIQHVKVSKLLEKNPTHIVEYVLLNTNLNRITQYNIQNVYDALHWNKEQGAVWGVGGYKTSEDNIHAHYMKHEHEFNNINNIQEYERYPIENFNKMQKCMLHSNGRDVFYSGLVNDVFIVCRWYDKKFYISSCYVVESGDKPGRYMDRL